MTDRSSVAQGAYEELRTFLSEFCVRHYRVLNLEEYIEVVASATSNELQFAAAVNGGTSQPIVKASA